MSDSANALSILVVDDEPGVANAIADLLRLDGHRVTTAVNGEQALQAAAKIPFHLIVSDLLMPGLAGDGLLRAMRAERRPPFWFAIMSSVTEPVLRQRTTDYDRFIPKPLDVGKLQSLVQDCAASPAIAQRLRTGAHKDEAA